MDWTAIHIQVRVKDLEAAAAIAQMAVPYGIYIEDYSDLEQQVEEIAHVDLIDQALLQKDRVHALVHLYIDATKNPLEAVSFLRERLEQEHIGYELKTEGVREEDWATSWQKYYHPIRVGRCV